MTLCALSQLRAIEFAGRDHDAVAADFDAVDLSGGAECAGVEGGGAGDFGALFDGHLVTEGSANRRGLMAAGYTATWGCERW